MKLKALLLATAGFAVAGSASAADLPVVAEPVDYVQVCDAYGAGFFKIPGKDTCLKIGGRIRTQFVTDNLQDNEGEKYEDYDAYVRGYLYLTSMTDTEIGLIKTYTEFYSEWDEKAAGTSKVGSAYVQIGASFADILIGRTTSQFDGFTGAVDVGVIGRNWSDESTLQIALTKSFGNGVTAAISAEDSSYRDGDTNSADYVGKIGISQGWGAFEVAAALHDTVKGAEDNYGYAIRGTATINLDMIAAGDKFVFQAAYADAASSYLGKSTAAWDAAGQSAWALGAGFTHYWTSEVATSIDGSYLTNDDADYDRWAIDASIGWYPVSGMVVALDGGFASEDAAGVDTDEAKIGARVQYTF
ncbi:porin [Pseudovibrio exalbescens]|uniref:porin n=1 Tax=Pseudovibrio exalbescens TaxID=197461 RepID=UPI0023660977|nr:porin [Pseudovibrio exalbescens]MDD7908353.1 porin [Pseudovibrio exalbescens]